MTGVSGALHRVLEEAGLHERRAGPDLRLAIESSPWLVGQMSEAARSGLLKHLRVSSSDVHAGGHYDAASKTIHINQAELARPNIEDRHDRIVGILGHENSHALEADRAKAAAGRLDFDVHRIVMDATAAGERRMDFTEAARRYLEEGRKAEARAELAGLNALGSRVAQEKGGAFEEGALLERAARTTGCVTDVGGRPVLANGLSVDSSGRFRGGQEALAQCHFDSSDATLGRAGDATYRNYYAGYVVERIEEATRHMRTPTPDIRLDMTALGIDPSQVQSAGLDFGRDGRSVTITDSTKGWWSFTHNHQRGGRHSPDTWIADQPPATGPEGRPAGGAHAWPLSAPGHPDHALYRTVSDSLYARLPAGAGVSEDRLAQITLAARQAGFRAGERVEVAFGDTWVSLQGEGPTRHARIDLATAPPSPQQAPEAAGVGQSPHVRQPTRPAGPHRDQDPAMALPY